MPIGNASFPSRSLPSLPSVHACRRPLSALALGALFATSGCSGLFTVKQEPLAAGAKASVTIPTSATTIDHVVSSNTAVASVLSVTQANAEVTAGVPGTATLTGYDASNHELGELSVTVAATASIGHDGWVDDGVTILTGEGFDVHAITLGSDGGTLEGRRHSLRAPGNARPLRRLGHLLWRLGVVPGIGAGRGRGGNDRAVVLRHRKKRIPFEELESARAAAASSMADPRAPGLWLGAYAWPASTKAEATAALAALARFDPLAPGTELTGEEFFIGNVFQLAGRTDDALPHLVRATNACDLLVNTFEHLHASLLLGQALESKRDIPGACKAYRVVLSHWGNAKPRSRTADAARSRAKALSCP